MLVTVLLVLSWLAWACRSHVTRYEVSDSARLEVNASAYPVQTNLSGRLVSSKLMLGREVHQGDVLAELESSAEELALQEERTRKASIVPQLAAVRAEMQSEEAGAGDERSVLTYSNAAALAQFREAEAQARLAQEQAERSERMRAEGIIAPAEADKAKADAQSKRAAAENLRVVMTRLEPELRVRERDREVRLRQLVAEQTKLEGDLATSEATLNRLEYDFDRRKIRAPVSGRLAECATLQPGSHLTEGQQLGVILPSSGVRVVAEFRPAAALGKLREGQAATVRLHGFPWAQFGVIGARVSQVASEIRDGKVRVELVLARVPASHIPVQHGLPGTVEVEVERATPAALLLRSAGSLVGAH